MSPRSVAILGGGPGGLYAARLIKLRHPACRVEVHEQGQPGETFGFGVGLATRTQRNLHAADPASLDAIVDASWVHDMSMSVGGERVRLPGGNLLAIGRSTLLDVLTRFAVDAGVELHHGSRVTATDLDADLVIAADGVNSTTRTALAASLGAGVEVDHGWYLWCGTDFALPSAVFSPVTTAAGTFVTHAYPYAADRSTFLVETDEETWRRAGFDATTEATDAGAWDASDEKSLTYLAEAFSEELHGHALIGNRTRWTQFRTISCQTWHHDRTVLLGDAAHTAHYSIGSGTKLAMEDAIVLDRALADSADIETALQSYEDERRPAVRHLQATARRSMRWWHLFARRLDLPVERLFISYMTRAGKVSLERFAQTAPEVVQTGLAEYAGQAPPDAADLTDWVVAQPFDRGAWHTADRTFTGAPGSLTVVEVTPSDDAWGTAGDAAVTLVEGSMATDAGVLVTCDPASDHDAVLTMLEIAERVRLDTGAVVVARAAPEMIEHLVAALSAGRIDLVDLVDLVDPAPAATPPGLTNEVSS